MENKFNSIEEINREIDKAIIEVSKYNKENVRQFINYYEALKRFEELKRIKFDFINGTHTNEIYHYKNYLRNAEEKYKRTYRGHRHNCEVMIDFYTSEIARLEELDKQKTLELK